MASAQSPAVCMTAGAFRAEVSCGQHRVRGGRACLDSSSSSSSSSASASYCGGGCASDSLTVVPSGLWTDASAVRARRRAVVSRSFDSLNGNITYNVLVLGGSSVGQRCSKPPTLGGTILGAAPQGLCVRHVDLENWVRLEGSHSLALASQQLPPWRSRRGWEGEGEKSQRGYSRRHSLRAAARDNHGYAQKDAGSDGSKRDGYGGGWREGSATSAPSRLPPSRPSLSSSSSPISHWDLLRNDVHYLDWRARQDVNSIKEAHDRVVEVLNPIARESKSISTLREQLTELQGDLAKAHEQVHLSEARVEHTMQRLLAMEELMNESYARVMKSSGTEEGGALKIDQKLTESHARVDTQHEGDKKGHDESNHLAEEEEEEEGKMATNLPSSLAMGTAVAAEMKSRERSILEDLEIDGAGSVSPSTPSPQVSPPVRTAQPYSYAYCPSADPSSSLDDPNPRGSIRSEKPLADADVASSSSSTGGVAAAEAARPLRKKKGLDVSGPPKPYGGLRNFWYPIAFSADVDEKTLVPFDCFEEPWVLFRNLEGRIGCVRDECAHRACPLSLGKVVDGRVQCPYHGWEFSTSGACERMPSTTPSRISVRSLPCVEQDGMIWVWPGTDTPAAHISCCQPPSGYTIHAQIVVDVPVEHGLLIENLLDLAHAPFTHTSTFAKGWAIPNVVQFKTMAASALRGHWEPYPIDMEFRPPCMVLSSIGLAKPGKLEGTNAHDCEKHLHQLHVCVPSSKGRTRLLYRMSLDFARWAKYVPYVDRLWQHMANQVLAEDMRLVEGQQDRMKRGANVWNYPVPYDQLGVRYRRWRISVENGNNLPRV